VFKKLLRDGAVVPDAVLDTITEWLADRLSADR